MIWGIAVILYDIMTVYIGVTVCMYGGMELGIAVRLYSSRIRGHLMC